VSCPTKCDQSSGSFRHAPRAGSQTTNPQTYLNRPMGPINGVRSFDCKTAKCRRCPSHRASCTPALLMHFDVHTSDVNKALLHLFCTGENNACPRLRACRALLTKVKPSAFIIGIPLLALKKVGQFPLPHTCRADAFEIHVTSRLESLLSGS
jgi:hypothetical protein